MPMDSITNDSLVTRTSKTIEKYIEENPKWALPVIALTSTIIPAAAMTAAIGLTEMIATAYHYTPDNDYIAAVSYENLAFLATSGGMVGATSLLVTLI